MFKAMRVFLVFTVIITLLSPVLLYAEEKHWQVKHYQTVRFDTQNEEDSNYLTRIAVPFSRRVSDELDLKLEFQPFFEMRYYWDSEKFLRKEIGLEAGFHLTKYGYVGESLHYAWLDNEENTFEFETRLEMNIPLILNAKGYEVTLKLVEEYTFSNQERKGTRNEIAANLIFPIVEHLELLCGWRHIDRIHDYDSDQVELTAIFVF